MEKGQKTLAQTITRTSYTRVLVVEEKTCPQCGKQFEGVRKRKFCSLPCQRKANYARHGEVYRAKCMEKYRQQKQQSTQVKG